MHNGLGKEVTVSPAQQANMLKNYGRSLIEAGKTIPAEAKRQAKEETLKTIKNELGLLRMPKLMVLMHKEKKRMLRISLAGVIKEDLNSEFIELSISRASLFSAMSKLIGLKKAEEVHNKSAAKTGTKIMAYMFPRGSDFVIDGDRFALFKDWVIALFEANKRDGIHEFGMAENNSRLLEINCTYCAFYAIPKRLGIGEAALPSCYADDVFLPMLCSEIGVEYSRKGTLARGQEFCDFSFYNIINTK